LGRGLAVEEGRGCPCRYRISDGAEQRRGRVGFGGGEGRGRRRIPSLGKRMSGLDATAALLEVGTD